MGQFDPELTGAAWFDESAVGVFWFDEDLEPAPDDGSITGSASSSFGALANTATGTVSLAASASKSLGALASTASGALALAGSASKSFGALAGSEAGSVAVVGASTRAFGALAGTEAGTSSLSGAAASSFGALGGVGAGSLPLAGASSRSFGALQGTETGAVALAGAETAAFGTLAGSAAGAVALLGGGATTFGALTGTADGSAPNLTPPIVGSAASSFAALQNIATGTLSLAAVHVAAFPSLVTSAVGVVIDERGTLEIEDVPLASILLLDSAASITAEEGTAGQASISVSNYCLAEISLEDALVAQITIGGIMADYNVGDTAQVRVTVKNTSGVFADPSSLVARVKPPSGPVVVYTYGSGTEWTKTATGKYTLDIDLTSAGLWNYRIESAGLNTKAAKEGVLKVVASKVL